MAGQRYFQTNFGRSNRIVQPDFDWERPNTMSAETDTDYQFQKLYEEPLKRYRTILSEEMPALQRLRSLGALVPKREDYELGIGGKIGAALAGFSAGFGNPGQAFAVAQQQREMPYTRALQDFGINREILGEQAKLERYDRQNRLSGAKAELDSIHDMIKENREYRTAESQDALRTMQGRNYQSQIDERLYNREHPELTPVETMTGTNWYNKRNPNQMISTGARTLGGFNAQTGRMNAETARTQASISGRRLDEDIQQSMFQRFNADRNYDISKGRADAYTDYLGRGASNKTPSPAAQARARQIAANELISLNPAYRDFIDEKGQYKSSSGFFSDNYNPKGDAFKNFRQEFEDRVNEILGVRTFNFSDLPDE